ncbi:MAG TPA: hypothetical protein VM513_06000 [Kofleriaceae bacterium]|nr:hypothetical protein [Kofleriaceae bacterium]
MVRVVVCLALAVTGCRPSHAPTARRAGIAMSLVGVVGLIASAAATSFADTHELVVGFSAMSGIGICTYAVGELSDPPKGVPPETEEQKLHRWARILTERAGGAAREGKCARVRRLEKRVHVYDPEVHDFVFMRDPEIQKCYAAPAGIPASTAEPAPDPGAAAPDEP